VVRDVLIMIELLAGVGALAFGTRMATRKSPSLQRSAARLLAIALLMVSGAALLGAAALLLAGVSQGRLISVEAGVLFTGWVAGHLALTSLRHWMQFVALAVGVAVVVLALALPSPG